jgi:hypothetical protein
MENTDITKIDPLQQEEEVKKEEHEISEPT